MKKQQRTRKAVILVNTFAAAGYVFLLLAYTLFAGALAWLLLFTVPGSKPYTTIIASPLQDTAARSDLGVYFIAAASLVFVVVVLLLLSYFIAKWCAHMLRHFMYKMKIPRTHRHLFLVKGGLAMIPLIGFIWLNVFYLGADPALPILHIMSIFTALASVVIFGFELFVARSLTVNPRDSW